MRGRLAELFSVAISVVSLVVALIARQDALRFDQGNHHAQLRACLESLSVLERDGFEATESDSRGCGPGDANCLGNLAMKRSHRDQYQLLAAEAAQIAKQIDKRVSPTELLEIASALYNAGDLQNSSEYAAKVIGSEPIFILRYRTLLLQAQIAFVQRKLEEGQNRIREAVKMVDDERDLTDIERRLLAAEAHLICASMNTTLGLPQNAIGCLRNTHESLANLPNTRVVNQLKTAVADQLNEIIRLEDAPGVVSFEQLEASLRADAMRSPVPPSYVPWPSGSASPEPTPASP